MWPNAKVLKSFHPSYENLIVHREFDINKFKLDLNINQSRILLFFGFIRPYKGLKYLLYAMKKIIEDNHDTHLLIVGECMGEDAEDYLRIIDDLGLNEHITFINRYVPTEELSPYFLLSNIVVLPYVSATQSGVVQLAYGFNKPVIVTDVGGLSEVVIHNRTGYVVEPCNSNAIAHAVIDYFKQNREEEMKKQVSMFKKNFSWEKLRSHIESLQI
jgi:glycosyltransferase involved in cell wall biosynthesis